MLKLLLDFLAAHVFLAGVGLLLFLGAFVPTLFFRYIPNNRVGIVEKLASAKGSIVSGLIAPTARRASSHTSFAAAGSSVTL